MKPDRERRIEAFLTPLGLADAPQEALPGDASTRRYLRLRTPEGRGLMLMDAPPSAESRPCPVDASPAERVAAGYNAMARLAAGRVDAFAACAAYLRGRGLSSPEVFALDTDAGLALVEDLGDGLFARLMESGANQHKLYFAAVDALARLHEEAPPHFLDGDGVSWPLLVYDDLALKTGADLFLEWLPILDPRLAFDEAARAGWEALWAPIRRRGEAQASVFTHRDFHAENLVWMPDREGAARVGMLDFQDAVRAHPAWDLLSLLRDARRDVPADIEAASLSRYFALRPDTDREAFMADYAALAALNEARILGIFARLIGRDGKPRYRQFMPRVWRCLEGNLRAPGMEGLRSWFDGAVPAESRT